MDRPKVCKRLPAQTGGGEVACGFRDERGFEPRGSAPRDCRITPNVG